MIKLKESNKETDLINDNIKPIDGIQNLVDEQTVASDVASLAVPESDESTKLPIPENINESHLFVVDGQECICVADTIPSKK